MSFRIHFEKLHLRPTGKNNKFCYYVRAWLRNFQSRKQLIQRRKQLLSTWTKRDDASYIRTRVDYYNRLDHRVPLSPSPLKVSDIPNRRDVYFRDSFEILQYFEKEKHLEIRFGDNTETPNFPAICKSRPLAGDNANAILLNMDKVRHFIFLNDRIPFQEKKNMAIFRGASYQANRIRFMNMYFGSSVVNCADTGHSPLKPEWKKREITLYDHLKFKFIISLEGNDVASNLKWIMSSNSIAMMPKPTFETWFMEGRLIPNVHYIEIANDCSDVEEKIHWYSNHLEASQTIIAHAHDWISQFQNKERELLIAILVMQKYFDLTN